MQVQDVTWLFYGAPKKGSVTLSGVEGCYELGVSCASHLSGREQIPDHGGMQACGILRLRPDTKHRDSAQDVT